MEDPDIVGILVKRKDFFKYWPMFFLFFFVTVGVKYESVRRSHKDKDGEIGEKYIKQSRYVLQMKAEGNLNSFFC